jgi:hypothetical protein
MSQEENKLEGGDLEHLIVVLDRSYGAENRTSWKLVLHRTRGVVGGVGG